MRDFLRERLMANAMRCTDEQIEQIACYVDLLTTWNNKINLTGHHHVEEIIDKDIIDCMYIIMYIITYKILYRITYRIMYRSETGSLLDIGCGAGFLGILASIMDPKARVGFVDSSRKKINFVREVSRQLKLKNISVYQQRAETLILDDSIRYNVAVTRATFKYQGVTQYVHNSVQNSVHNSGHFIWMLGPNEKIDGSEALDLCDLQRISNFDYTIQPEKYQRRALIYKKINTAVSREHGQLFDK